MKSKMYCSGTEKTVGKALGIRVTQLDIQNRDNLAWEYILANTPRLVARGYLKQWRIQELESGGRGQ